MFDQHPARRDAAARQVPTGQLIQPLDVATQVAHLCEPGNKHTTGSVVLMDGGLSLLAGNDAHA